VIDSSEIKDVWKKYMEKWLNEENEWDGKVDCERIEIPSCRIMQVKLRKLLKKMKRGKAAGPTGFIAEMFTASGDLGVEWLTDICNSIVNEERIPSDWKRSTLVPVYKGKGVQWNVGLTVQLNSWSME
jgi:hypothetical protein